MDHRTPLTMPEATAIWLRRLPDLYVDTVNYLRKAPLTRPARKADLGETGGAERKPRSRSAFNLASTREMLVTNVDLHEEIVQELAVRFFRAVGRGKVWAGTQVVRNKRTGEAREVASVDCWLSRVHKRVAR